jgi:SAM-dependent methyltransferase
VSDDARRLVGRGYDQMAERFAAWRNEIEESPELDWVRDLVALLPERPDVLELGCGAAEEPTLLLAERGPLLGIDISGEQLQRARDRCPRGTFMQADMVELQLDIESFEAVVALYVFNHVPRADLPALLGKAASWLRPGGYLLATFGVSGGEGVEEDWLGVPMFFASYTETENRALVRAAGFTIERDEVVSIAEPEGDARFQFLLARRTRSHRPWATAALPRRDGDLA